MKPRNITAYESDYNRLPFEPVQAALRRQAILAEIEKFKASRILEIGCGMQPIFESYCGFEAMTIVEPSPLFAENARTLARQNCSLNITVEQAFLEDVALAPNSFDLIILSSLLHEVKSPEALLRKAISGAHSDTIFLVNVPNETSFHRRFAERLGIIHSTAERSSQQQLLQQQRIFNCASLCDLLTSCGLRVFDTYTIIFKPFTHQQMQAILDHGILSRQQIEILSQMSDLMEPSIGSEIISLARLE